MRRRHPSAVLLCVALLLRCDGSPVVPELEQPARLSIHSLEISSSLVGESVWVRVDATITPGRFSDGSQPVLSDRCLYVLGFGFCPSAHDLRINAGAWIPARNFELQPFLRAPVIRHVGAPELRWSLPHRVGPDTLFAGSAERPALRMSAAGGGAEAAITGWQVFVPIVPPPFRGPHDRIAASGAGPPPAVIPLPDSALSFAEPVVVTLSYGVRYSDGVSQVPGYVIGGPSHNTDSIGSIHHRWVLMPR